MLSLHLRSCISGILWGVMHSIQGRLTFLLAMDDVENSIRETCILSHLCQHERGPRILLTWLQDKCVSYHCSQRKHLGDEGI